MQSSEYLTQNIHLNTFSTKGKESPPLISANASKINATRIFMDETRNSSNLVNLYVHKKSFSVQEALSWTALSTRD